MLISLGRRRPAPRSPSSPADPPDFDAPTIALCEAVRPYTMTGPERVDALRQAVAADLKQGGGVRPESQARARRHGTCPRERRQAG